MTLRTLWLRWKFNTPQATKASVIKARIWLRPRQVLPLVLLQGKAINLPQYHTRHPSTTWSAPLLINNSWRYQSRPLRMGQNPYPWCPAEPTEQWRPPHPLPLETKVLLLQKKKKKITKWPCTKTCLCTVQSSAISLGQFSFYVLFIGTLWSFWPGETNCKDRDLRSLSERSTGITTAF